MSTLKIAIQKSGRLSEKSLQLLESCGIQISNGERKLKAIASNFPIEVLYLRDDDIPQYVEQGVADIGILGENESGKNKNRGLKDKELLQQFLKKRNSSSPGYLRTLEISFDKIENAILMITNAFKKGFNAQYVLADSWFISEKFIKEVTALKNKKVEKLDVIGILQSNRILQIGTKKFKGTDVPELYRNNVKFIRKYKCSYIRLKVDYKGIILNAFWIRMKGQE